MKLFMAATLIGWAITAIALVNTNSMMEHMRAGEKELIEADAILKSADSKLKIASGELAKADAELKSSCEQLQELVRR